MRRRTVLRRAGIGMTGLVATGLAGCSGDSDDGGGTPTLPDIEISGQQLGSTIDELSIVDQSYDILRGQRHDDVHFAVTPTVRNDGDQEASLQDYQYDLTLYDRDDSDITPGNTWKARPDTVQPGETGTILIQVTFSSAPDTYPEDVDRYELILTCGPDNAGSYC